MTHKTLGEMTDAEIGAMVRAYKSGQPIEYINHLGCWVPCRNYQPFDMRTSWRIAPEPIRQAVIPWEVFTDEVVAVAMDCDGDWGAYIERPKCGDQYWRHDSQGFSINNIKFDRGNKPDWRNTLQMRPGHEVL